MALDRLTGTRDLIRFAAPMTEALTNDNKRNPNRGKVDGWLFAESTRREFLAFGALVAGAVLLPFDRLRVATAQGRRPARIGWVGQSARLEADTPYLLGAARSKLVKVVAVADATPKRRELCQEIVSFETGKKPVAFEDYRALLESGSVEAVLCTVSSKASLPVFRACLEAGVHCFGLYPEIGATPDLRSLLELQARHPDVKVQFSSPWRYQLRYREAARLVREDQVLGRLTGCRHRLVSRGGAERVFPGCDLVSWFTGRWPLRARPDQDPASPVVLEYSDGFTVRFWSGATTFSGTLGDMDAPSGKISYKGPVVGTRRVDGTRLWQPRPEVRELEDFFETIVFDRMPLVSVGQLRDSVLVSLLARKAHQEKRIVTLAEVAA